MSECIVPKDFYVYVHRRATDGKIFYVGKGHGKRAWSKARSKYWHNVANKHGYVVELVAVGLLEWYAFELECELIALCGRETLCNMTDGGEGASGCIPSEETRSKLSFARKGKPLSETNRLNVIKSLSNPKTKEKWMKALSLAMSKPEVKEKRRVAISAAKKGKPLSEKNKVALSLAARIARAKAILCEQTGQIFETTYCAQAWLRANGKPKALGCAVYGCCVGSAKSAYGYTWRYA